MVPIKENTALCKWHLDMSDVPISGDNVVVAKLLPRDVLTPLEVFGCDSSGELFPNQVTSRAMKAVVCVLHETNVIATEQALRLTARFRVCAFGNRAWSVSLQAGRPRRCTADHTFRLHQYFANVTPL